MRTLLSSGLVFATLLASPPTALAGPPVAAPDTITAANGVVLTNTDPVITAFRSRDAVSCGSLPSDPDLAAKLDAIAEADIAPSWVPMRAATCLGELYANDARFADWVGPWFSDDDRGGLAVAVLDGTRSDATAQQRLAPLALAATGRWAPILARHLR